ncbi:Na+/H+ antiporter NhaA [Curtobacterium sp. MCBD17_019]|uniref:Na+/H+ antiporter NhaA n=1 Tax=Curtobacterium sp. MCBD17_019 TaxID=2175669 RepID=UPI000DAABDCC|nr:Na+/H+ antiporter NhaA [Curtobacterium sp. MCBD17_019]PZE75427.1 sodium:proton antiporter [Curtobacterium sp. MCBD17_019]
MPAIVRSERFSAVALLTAAVLGLAAANSPLGPGLEHLLALHTPWSAVGLDLSIAHWVSDGLLVAFFLLIAIELKHELTIGQLSDPRTAIVPAIAAVGGVVVPAVLYLAVAQGTGLEHGWPIPTATDIAFALGILAIFGRGLPSRLRVFLLALAVLDDLIAIVIIAIVFAHGTDLGLLGLAVVALAAFAVLARSLRRVGRARPAIVVGLVVLGVVTWWLVLHSGVHATIAGVALGLVLPRRAGHTVRHAVEPWSNGVVLPVFAFTSAAVAVPAVGFGALSPAFWAIVLALPVGKVVGITLFGGVATQVFRHPERPTLSLSAVATVGVLGGVGFTVSLLMNELAFVRTPRVADQGTLAVLVGSGVAMVASAVVVALGARRARSERAAAPGAP